MMGVAEKGEIIRVVVSWRVIKMGNRQAGQYLKTADDTALKRIFRLCVSASLGLPACDLTGWNWTRLIERIDLEQGSHPC